MRRAAVVLAVILLAASRAADASPVERQPPMIATLDAYRSLTLAAAFKSGERAAVIVSGSGATYMAVFVYDEHGNCVGKDEPAAYPVRDDLVVVWYPPRTGRYTVEVRNNGALPNRFQMAVR